MNPLVLKINKADNVLVALQDLPKGAIVLFEGVTYTTTEVIPAKHKFFMQDMHSGDEVHMYGVLVGKVQFDVPQGARMNVDNTKHAAEPFAYREVDYVWEAPDVSHYANRTFNGYHRPNGDVGTANYWLFIPTVFCENRNLSIIKESLYSELGYAVDDKYKSYTHKLVQAYENGEDILNLTFEPSAEPKANRTFKNIDGIKFLNHNGGCGGTRQDSDTLSKLLAAYADHPNVAGVTVLSLGCQHLQLSDFNRDVFARNPRFDKPVFIFEQQKAQSEEQLIQQAIRDTFVGLIEINKFERKPATLDKLTVGVKCGGSDGFSGISANPAVGHTADLLVGLGAKVLLAEFPELCGVEQEMIDRSVDRPTAEKFIKLMTEYDELAHKVGSGFYMNPSPTIKVATNSILANRMADIIDIDTGPVIRGEKTIAQMGEDILEYCIKVASGEEIPKAVQLNQDDFIPWKRGVSL